MIILNGHKYVQNDKEAIDTLFDKDGKTFTGYYKVTKAGIVFMDMQKRRIGVLNAYGVLCACHQPAELNGKNYYTLAPFTDINHDGIFSNQNKGYAEKRAELEKIILDNGVILRKDKRFGLC